MDSILLDDQRRLNIKRELINLVSLIHSENCGNRQSLNISAESFFMRFLNILFDWKLQNANRLLKQNAKGIDLIDTENRIIVQVSSKKKHDKVQDSLSKSSGFSGYHLYFLAIASKYSPHGFIVPPVLIFDEKSDVFDNNKLMAEVDRLGDAEKLEALSELVGNEVKHRELCAYLDRLLRDTRETHPSFRLMNPDEVDERLFPGVKKVEAFEAQGTRDEDGKPGSVWELIAESWQQPGNRSIVIEGGGGIGKTVTLLSPSVPLPAPALYLHLYELVEDGKTLTVSEHLQRKTFGWARDIDKRAAQPREDGPSLILLLDGFNEIPGEKRREVLHKLNEWHTAHPGAQYIAVSRPLDELNLVKELAGKPIGVTLAPLGEVEITAYLKAQSVELPEEASPLWEVLGYPLFLTLYVKTGRITETEAEGYPLNFKEARSKGAVIWNYLQRELLREPNETWILSCALACEYILPRIAWEMLKEQSFTIERRMAVKLIQEALSEIQIDRLPIHLSQIRDYYEYQHFDKPDLSCAEWNGINWSNLVLRDVSLLLPERQEDSVKLTSAYSFPHQNFRDCLAGLYLVNQAEAAAENALPEVWKHTPNLLALDYAAELMDKPTAEKLWEANRKLQPTDKAATLSMLELQKRRKAERPALNFSGMDLRGLGLTRYCGQGNVDLGLFHDAALSKGTQLDDTCFRGQGHSDWVTCVAVTADGLCVSGSDDHTLRVWDLHSVNCLNILEGHSDRVNCVVVTKDGLCVSGSDDDTLRVWNLRSGVCLHTLKGHSNPVTCVAVTEDGLCVSGSWDHTLCVWALRSGKCLHTLKGHDASVECVAVTERNLCISGSDDHTLRVWDLRSGDCLHELRGHSNSVTCVAVTEDGLCVSGSEDNTLRVWDLRSSVCLHTLKGHNASVTCVAVTADGLCVSGSVDHTLRVWDLSSGVCLHTLEGHSAWVRCAAVTADGLCVSGSDDHTLRAWGLRDGDCLYTLEGHRNVVTCVAVTEAGLCVSGLTDHTLRIWDLSSGIRLHTMKGHNGTVTSVAVTGDGSCVSGSVDHTLRVWDLRSGEFIRILKELNDEVNCVAVTMDGLCISGLKDHTLRVLDFRSGYRLQALEGHIRSVTCVAITKNGLCVSGSSDANLCVWELRSSICLHTLKGHNGTVTSVAANGDGLCVSGSLDGTLRVWDLRSGDCLYTLKGHGDSVTSVAVTADGLCVSGSWDSTLRVWDLRSGDCLHTLEGHGAWVKCVATTGDGLCVSGSNDGTMRVWDIHTGQCLDVLRTTEIDVSRMDFSQAILDPANPDLARALWQNGAKLSPTETEKQERYRSSQPLPLA